MAPLDDSALSGVFYMDNQIEKYRFGITLELDPTLYRFITDTIIPYEVQTICKGSIAWMLSQGVTLIPNGNNAFICQDIPSLNIIRLLLQDYWISVGGICPE